MLERGLPGSKGINRSYIAKRKESERPRFVCCYDFLALKEGICPLCHPQDRPQAQPVTAPAHTSLVEYRLRVMERAKRQDLVIPWNAAAGATCCPFLLRRQPMAIARPKQ